MPGSDEFDALIKLLRATSAEAAPAAENAAAAVYRDAAIAAAPRRSGQLAASIKIIEGRPLKSLMGETRQRLFVGPEKKKGYYGYFIEKGYTATGRATRAKTGRRSARNATATTHGQKGISGGRHIPGRPWFAPAIAGADSRAVNAAETAFDVKLKQLDT